jgi:hypothetical protein
MTGDVFLDSLFDPIVSELPDRRVPEAYAWAGHVPFALWLMNVLRPRRVVELGTHWGHSYFAMCQARTALGLDTEMFAVDTWMGDEHAGYYGGEVFADVAAWNGPRYGDFSTLLRMTFDEARGRFDQGSIDLLHIDGLHTHEAVRADFEAWVPGVANGGVVILHDTAERTEGFGVWRFFEELKSDYPTFGFDHSHGLGVVGIGTGHPAPIRALLDASDARAGVARRFFSTLGDRVVQVIECARLEGELRAVREEAEARQKILDDVSAEARHRQEVIDELAAEAEHRKITIEGLAAEAAHRRQVIDELAAEAEHRLEIIEQLTGEKDRAATEARRLQDELDALQKAIAASPVARLAVRQRRRPA